MSGWLGWGQSGTSAKSSRTEKLLADKPTLRELVEDETKQRELRKYLDISDANLIAYLGTQPILKEAFEIALEVNGIEKSQKKAKADLNNKLIRQEEYNRLEIEIDALKKKVIAKTELCHRVLKLGKENGEVRSILENTEIIETDFLAKLEGAEIRENSFYLSFQTLFDHLICSYEKKMISILKSNPKFVSSLLLHFNSSHIRKLFTDLLSLRDSDFIKSEKVIIEILSLMELEGEEYPAGRYELIDEIINLFVDQHFINSKAIVNKLLQITFKFSPDSIPSPLPDAASFENCNAFNQGSEILIKILTRVYAPPPPNSDFVPGDGPSSSPRKSSSSKNSLADSQLSSFVDDSLTTSSGSVHVKSGDDDFNFSPFPESPYLIQSLTLYFPLFNSILSSALREKRMKTFRISVLHLVGLIFKSKFIFLYSFGIESDLFITLMKLFFEFKWNNIIHCQVTDIYRSFFLSKQNQLIELFVKRSNIHENLAVFASNGPSNQGNLGHIVEISKLILYLTENSHPTLGLTVNASQIWFSHLFSDVFPDENPVKSDDAALNDSLCEDRINHYLEMRTAFDDAASFTAPKSSPSPLESRQFAKPTAPPFYGAPEDITKEIEA